MKIYANKNDLTLDVGSVWFQLHMGKKTGYLRQMYGFRYWRSPRYGGEKGCSYLDLWLFSINWRTG